MRVILNDCQNMRIAVQCADLFVSELPEDHKSCVYVHGEGENELTTYVKRTKTGLSISQWA